MIRGKIRQREAVIPIEVSGPIQNSAQFQAVIDTGYNGYLTLPADAVATLQLPFAGYRRGRLADGSVTSLEVFLAVVTWEGQSREVLIAQTTGAPLVGMSLMEGCR